MEYNYLTEQYPEIITQSPKMLQTLSYLEILADTPYPLLITGETGTGKELAARAVHNISQSRGKFIALNTAGIDDTVFSDTLFGHEKGAYTGAESERPGTVEEAKNGTLFLDEIGDLKPEIQIKLLRLLQENEYYKLGTNNPEHAECRFIFATNKRIDELRQNAEFRSALFYRLAQNHIHICLT